MSTSAIAKIEPPIAGHDDPFTVASRLEITHILHAIMRDAALITVHVDVIDFFLTSVLAIDEKENCMYLERGRGRATLSNALTHRKFSYSTALDKVRISFACEGIEPVSYAGEPAYKIALPIALQRIQRRESYRMATPVAMPVKCQIFANGNPGEGGVDLMLYDISCGGIAVRSLPASFYLAFGESYSSTLFLPGTSGLQIMLQARNAFMITLLNGETTQRAGFAFVNPPESILATIQRYILTLERQHRSRGGRGR